MESSLLFSLFVLIGITSAQQAEIVVAKVQPIKVMPNIRDQANGANDYEPRLHIQPWQLHNSLRGLRRRVQNLGNLGLFGLPGLQYLVNPAIYDLLGLNNKPPTPAIGELREVNLPVMALNEVDDMTVNHVVPIQQSNCLERVWSPSCPKGPAPFIVHINSMQINRIVDQHNANRRLLAASSVVGYPQNSEMFSLKWSPKLSYLAEKNVMQCKMLKENCFSEDFKVSGQHLALSAYAGSINARSDDDLINTALETWWQELATSHVHNSIGGMPNGYLAQDHYQAMLQQYNASVGCAASRFFQDEQHNFLMACYYAYANWNRLPQHKMLSTYD